MPDILTAWSPGDGRGDWVVVGPDLVASEDLETAVLISLFTDAPAAPDDEVPDGSGDRRGWWGNAGRDQPIGSKLWLLERAKETEATRLRAQDYILEALQWLVDAGIVGAVTADVSWQRPGFLGAQIQLLQVGGGIFRSFNYQWAWKGVT